MSIFSEVGKLIMEEAENKAGTDGSVKNEGLNETYEDAAALSKPPEIEGEIIMDGEDMLRVIHIDHIVPSPQESSGLTTGKENYKEDDLSFWEPHTGESASTADEESFKPTQKEESPNKIPSVSMENTITGDIIFPADAAVHANITGNVTAKGLLTVEGVIVGNVEARDVVLRGIIHGSLKCEKLTLLPVDTGTSKRSAMSSVKGSITAGALFTELT